MPALFGRGDAVPLPGQLLDEDAGEEMDDVLSPVIGRTPAGTLGTQHDRLTGKDRAEAVRQRVLRRRGLGQRVGLYKHEGEVDALLSDEGRGDFHVARLPAPGGRP